MPKSPEGDRNRNEESALSPRRMAEEIARDVNRIAGGHMTREQIRAAMPESILDDLEPKAKDGNDGHNSQAEWYRTMDRINGQII